MKKLYKALAVASFAGLSSLTLTSCIHYDLTLVIYNWEDYIDEGTDELGNIDPENEGTIIKFQNWYQEEYGLSVYVDYETFSTPEDMYNQMKIGAISPDLICPSDYMIQKMYREGMLLEFDYDKETNTYGEALQNFEDYGSPYIKKMFRENDFSTYAIPYFWGTMGFIYDPDYVDEEDVSTWSVLSNPDYKGKIAIKNSIRDTYASVILTVYSDEVTQIKEEYDNGLLSDEDYNQKLSEIFNRCDNETLNKVESYLINDVKKNIYGLEVDDGKNEIVKGTYNIDVAWSGDAVYALDTAEESDKYLCYSLPEEGSNVWFDGWCMPKGANKDLAQAFINFLSDPEIAACNMDYCGYTSPIVGEAIWDLINDWYAFEAPEDITNEDELKDLYDEVDLTFYFGDTIPGGAVIQIDKEERGRQFDAQYPDEATLMRCCIMKDFGDQTNALNQMWINFKASY